jgi:hypothetical protein
MIEVQLILVNYQYKGTKVLFKDKRLDKGNYIEMISALSSKFFIFFVKKQEA